MIFAHCHPKGIEKLDTITAETSKNGSRMYTIPDGKKYPSVTTVLSILSRQHIMEWRKRVGAEEANKIGARAAGRGTRIHNLVEKTLQNIQVEPKPVDTEMYSGMERVLRKRVNNIRLQEKALYSHNLRMAGRCDCIAEYRGVLSVIDFKTSLRLKTPEHIEGHFLQACAYGTMYAELFGQEVEEGVIIIGVDYEKPQVFRVVLREWHDKLIQVRDQYESEQEGRS